MSQNRIIIVAACDMSSDRMMKWMNLWIKSAELVNVAFCKQACDSALQQPVK